MYDIIDMCMSCSQHTNSMHESSSKFRMGIMITSTITYFFKGLTCICPITGVMSYTLNDAFGKLTFWQCILSLIKIRATIVLEKCLQLKG